MKVWLIKVNHSILPCFLFENDSPGSQISVHFLIYIGKADSVELSPMLALIFAYWSVFVGSELGLLHLALHKRLPYLDNLQNIIYQIYTKEAIDHMLTRHVSYDVFSCLIPTRVLGLNDDLYSVCLP